MPQVKKAAVRDAILDSAMKLIRTKGYRDIHVAEIAANANVALANLYRYFPSKLHIFYEVFRPWIVARLKRLTRDAGKIEDPKERLVFILVTIWRDIPRENEGLASILMQAIAVAENDDDKPSDLLAWCEEQVAAMIRDCVPADRRHTIDDGFIAYLVWMAFDGFAINVRFNESRDIEKIAMTYADMLIAVTAAEPGQVRRDGRRGLEIVAGGAGKRSG